MSPKRGKRHGRNEDAERHEGEASPNGRGPSENGGDGSGLKDVGRAKAAVVTALNLWTKNPPKVPLQKPKKTPPKWYPPGGGDDATAAAGKEAGGGKRR